MTFKYRPTLVAASALAAVIVATPAAAQARRVDNGYASMRGFVFYWETQLDPPTPPLAEGSFFGAYEEASPNQVNRMFLDRVTRVYFGYSVQLDTQPQRNAFRLTFQPLSLTPGLQKHFGDDAVSWKPLPVPRFPAPQIIRAGEVLELPLLSNTNWGQRLTEYLTVQEPAPRVQGFQDLNPVTREFSFAAGAPHDFTVNDVALRLQNPRVFINGRFEELSARTMGEESGAVVWMYLPNRGRFLLSVVPNAQRGFRRAGEIRGNSLRFTVGSNTFSVTSASRIAPGTAAYNLYVLHQPDWRPTYANADVDLMTIGAADSVTEILGDGRKTYTAEAMRNKIRNQK